MHHYHHYCCARIKPKSQPYLHWPQSCRPRALWPDSTVSEASKIAHCSPIFGHCRLGPVRKNCCGISNPFLAGWCWLFLVPVPTPNAEGSVVEGGAGEAGCAGRQGGLGCQGPSLGENF